MPPTQFSQIKLPRMVKHIVLAKKPRSPNNKLTTEERNEFKKSMKSRNRSTSAKVSKQRVSRMKAAKVKVRSPSLDLIKGILS